MRLCSVYIVAIIAAIIPSSGCFGDVLGIHYNVVIDSSFSDTQKQYIRTAVGLWENILGDDLDIMTITGGSCNAAFDPTGGGSPPGSFEIPNPGTMRQICIHTSTGAWIRAHTSETDVIGLTYRHPTDDSADIYLPVDVDDTLPYYSWIQVAAHEVGHAMALLHSQSSTLMYWDSNGASIIPTCNDSAQFLSIRHASTITRQCPQGGFYILQHN